MMTRSALTKMPKMPAKMTPAKRLDFQRFSLRFLRCPHEGHLSSGRTG
jgi:hypothetical protein